MECFMKYNISISEKFIAFSFLLLLFACLCDKIQDNIKLMKWRKKYLIAVNGDFECFKKAHNAQIVETILSVMAQDYWKVKFLYGTRILPVDLLESDVAWKRGKEN